ncbi:MAG: tRNA-dihydrouridine synthase family protein [Vicinamibacterales bacterium]
MAFLEQLRGALVMGPMTKGSNLPYRRLCVELGARVTVSEMTVARRLKQRRAGEFALIRRFEGEPCFGVQLAATNPDEMAWATALVVARGAEFVDVNCGCPIDHFTHKGLGASLGRQPSRQRRLVEAMKRAAGAVPVTAKIRLGWNDTDRNYLDQVRAIADGGADAVTVHGRTRNARYRTAADWEAIAEIAAAVAIPVIGNGDILYGQDAETCRVRAGCAAVMTARAALIRPWIFREHLEGYRELDATARVAVYRRYVALAREHWGDDAHGLERVRTFTRWHLDFWHRDMPRRADGSFPSMQVREDGRGDRSPLDALLARADPAAHEFLADCLVDGRDIEPALAPPPGTGVAPALAEIEG